MSKFPMGRLIFQYKHHPIYQKDYVCSRTHTWDIILQIQASSVFVFRQDFT
ncbi:hypothetical protein [Prevotella communis]|uniref:hypothetical protein n=1 Tax=Prevotella communis TaxID=2913614 RepID=UPI001C40B55F|nr:hypothetical protein [Prevotella communis]